MTWRLLDLIDAPKVQKPNGIVFNYPNILYPLDDNMIFWFINGIGYVTILELYRYVFQKPLRFTDDMNIFIVSPRNIAYRLDINDKAIRFMEKAVVLGGD